MSYRIILADDEPKILQLIKLLGRWERYGIEIIDECHDGISTLESIREHRPDAVISDIKMPEMDGIELIQKVRNEGIDTLFVLISGYRHFEYARSAISLNVVDYLLKPIDEEQLNRTLEKMVSQLERRDDERKDRQELDQIRNARKNQRLEQFWAELTSDPESGAFRDMHLESEEACNAFYHTAFQYSCYQFVTISTNLNGVLQQSSSLLEDTLDKLLHKYFISIAVSDYHMSYQGGILLFNFPPEKRREMKEGIKAVYYVLRDMREIYGEFRLHFGVSNVAEGIQNLRMLFRNALAAEWGRLVTMNEGVLDYAQIASLPRFKVEDLITAEDREMIGACLKYLRREELNDRMETIYKRSMAYHNSNPADMCSCFYALVEYLLSCIPEEKTGDERENLYYAYTEARSFPQVFKNLYLCLDEYVTEEWKKVRAKAGKPINDAVRYIHEHFAELISEEDVAAYSNVSSTYLSKLFKEEMGIGFKDYLTNVRLEESEKLLADTNLSIREIAVAVGYPDEKYFSKLFKKLTGIKPTEYRKIYG